MKFVMTNLALGLLAATSMSTAFAATESWTGSGSEYSPDGQELSPYTVTVTNTQLADGVVDSIAKVTAADGTLKVIEQKLTMHGSSWSDDASIGHGGGNCYGRDLCENYIVGEGGMSYATTIIFDAPNTRRELTIVMKDGKAVKVLKENLHLQ